jgi:hypothetical protein
MLNDTYYMVWSAKMKFILRNLRVWKAVEGDDAVDEEVDEGAMAALSQSVPDSMVMTLANYATAKEAWEAIREMRVGEDKVKRAHAQVLKRQLNKLEMSRGETVAEYSVKITNLVSEIKSLGGSVTDTEVVEKLFLSVTDKFKDIIRTIEQFSNITKMTIPEAIERLRTHEENQKGKKEFKDNGEKLLYSHADLEARIAKERKKYEGSSSKKTDGRGGGKGRGQDCPQEVGRGKGDHFIDEIRPRDYDIS